MIRIGLDPGFGNFKVATVNEGGIHVSIVPSVVGVGETDVGMLSIGTLGRRRRRSRPDKVTFGGVTYLVGEGVARFARPVQRMDFLRLSDGPELRALFYDVVFRLLGEGAHRDTALMVGLPVEVMADRDKAKATLRVLRGWMVSRHRFAVNDEAATLNVVEARAMVQPAGTFFAWGLDNSGKWTRAKADLKAPVAICDIGFNTLDLFAVQGGEVVARFTGPMEFGPRALGNRSILYQPTDPSVNDWLNRRLRRYRDFAERIITRQTFFVRTREILRRRVESREHVRRCLDVFDSSLVPFAPFNRPRDLIHVTIPLDEASSIGGKLWNGRRDAFLGKMAREGIFVKNAAPRGVFRVAAFQIKPSVFRLDNNVLIGRAAAGTAVSHASQSEGRCDLFDDFHGHGRRAAQS